MCVLKEIPLHIQASTTHESRARRGPAHARATPGRAPHRVDRETKRDDYGDGPYESITINLPVDLAGSLGNLCHLSGGVKQRRRRIARWARCGLRAQDAKLDKITGIQSVSQSVISRSRPALTRTGIFYPRYHYSLVDT